MYSLMRTIFIFILSIGLWRAQSRPLLWVLWINDNGILQVFGNARRMSLTVIQFPLDEDVFER